MSYSYAAAQAAERKQRRPDLYCPDYRCLWMTGGGRCPRHGGGAWTADKQAAANAASQTPILQRTP